MIANITLLVAIKNFFHLKDDLQSVKLEDLAESTGYSVERVRQGIEQLLNNYKGLKGNLDESNSFFIVEKNAIYCEKEQSSHDWQSMSSFNCPSCGMTTCIWCFGPRLFLDQFTCPNCFKKMPIDDICLKKEEVGIQSRYLKALELFMDNRVVLSSKDLETMKNEREIPVEAKLAVLLSLGSCYLNMKKLDKAWKCFKQVQELAPGDPLLHLVMGILYEMEEKDEKALQKYRDALEVEPDNPMVHIALGNLLEVLGRYHQALAAYKKAIELDKENADYWVNLGDFYDLAEEDEPAEEAYIKATELEPNNSEIWKILGFFYEVRDRKTEAAMCYVKVIELSPEDSDTANYMNLFLKTSNNILLAKELYQQALSLDNPETWNDLARSYQEIGDHDKAIYLFEKSLKKDPSQMQILKEIATLYQTTDQIEKATELFKKLEELEKTYFEKNGVVNSYTHNILQETVDFVTASQKMAGNSGGLLHGMPWEEVRVVAVTNPDQQAYKQLIEYLEKILLFNPEDKGTLAKLASIYKKIGNKVKFEEFLHRLHSLES
ncbi:MAG: tetratricopeptide repeat protein [Candidatus Hodarchaeales archaeon]|jgi:tetratricopeptide (TPR) repeat protein/predicted RNA-binding Zn-ribbon protein involved in translation (DUF1610 family)